MGGLFRIHMLLQQSFLYSINNCCTSILTARLSDRQYSLFLFLSVFKPVTAPEIPLHHNFFLI